MPIIKIGCCGFPVSRAKYVKVFKLVEVQQTFYKLPSLETLRRWRSEVPPDFEFTMKAWQVITHPPTSPTWRKAGIKVEPSKEDRYGLLKPTKENLEAWEKTLEAAKELNARIIVVQTPPSFGYTEENLRNAIDFFKAAQKPGIIIAWEPRGTWLQNLEAIKRVIEETNIIHVVDILKRRPVVIKQLSYIRLHGLGGEINYRYKYTDDDLNKLYEEVKKLIEEGSREVYVLFNNIYMFEDAKRFQDIVQSKT